MCAGGDLIASEEDGLEAVVQLARDLFADLAKEARHHRLARLNRACAHIAQVLIRSSAPVPGQAAPS